MYSKKPPALDSVGICPILEAGMSVFSLSYSKIFAMAKNCEHKLKIIELMSAVVRNMSAIKTANLNLRYDDKMADHISNSIFVLKLVSTSFHIQKCNLRPTLFLVA